MPLWESIYEETGDEATKSEHPPPPPKPWRTKEKPVEYPQKTLILGAENPRQEKGTFDPEREGSKAKGTQKATKRPEDYPNRKVELKKKRGTEDAVSDKNQGKSKKKRWRKVQQVKARKDAKKRKPTEQKEATQRREEEHRGKR